MTRSLPTAPRSLRYGGVIACAAAILYASVIDPGAGTPTTLFGVGASVYLHFLAYGGLAGAVGHAVLAVDRRTLLAAVTVAALYGGGVEVVQGFLAYRTMSLFDTAVNAAGAAVGALVWRGVAPWFGAPARATRLSASTE